MRLKRPERFRRAPQHDFSRRQLHGATCSVAPPCATATIALSALCLGSLILLFLFLPNLRNVSIGILMVIAGYGLEFAGAMKHNPETARG